MLEWTVRAMREILFRGKREDNGEWAYGYYVRLPSAAGSVHKMYVPAENPDESNAVYYIDPKTLGQYTGLTDKNGVKIFEGDIVWFDGGWEEYGGNTFEVVFTNGCFYLGRNPDTVCFLLKAYIEWAEVIGNIYDNPELLGGGK